MRLFIALKPDNRTLSELVLMQEQMKKQGVYGNYTPFANLHLTLAFIGEYGDPEKVLEIMRSAEFSPFTLSVKGVGNFGDLYFADIAVSENLRKFATDLRAALERAGIPCDKKSFTPHITLLRRASRPFSRNIAVKSAPMTADRVILMRSDRAEKGMIYTPLGYVKSK